MSTNRIEHPEWTDRLSDYVAGELPDATRAEMEAHLSECGGCRLALEELREVIAKAEALGPIDPPRDLWAGIAATIQAPLTPPHAQTKVIAFPGQEAARAEPPKHSGRVSFSTPQLAAASIALIAASSFATWMAGPGLGVSPAAEVDPFLSDAGVTMVSDAAPPPPELADELHALERTLEEARGVLDPNTVRILERNLAVIEQAIVDSRLALQQDPENEFLARHLERVYERKLDFLREAARVAEWSD
jgi:hypothetical protein